MENNKNIHSLFVLFKALLHGCLLVGICEDPSNNQPSCSYPINPGTFPPLLLHLGGIYVLASHLDHQIFGRNFQDS